MSSENISTPKTIPYLAMKPFVVDKGIYKLSLKPIGNQYEKLHIQTCILTDIETIADVNWDTAKKELHKELDCFKKSRLSKIKYINIKRVERESRIAGQKNDRNEPLLSTEQIQALRIDVNKPGFVDIIPEFEPSLPETSLLRKYTTYKNNEKREFTKCANKIHLKIDKADGIIAEVCDKDIKRTVVIIDEIFDDI